MNAKLAKALKHYEKGCCAGEIWRYDEDETYGYQDYLPRNSNTRRKPDRDARKMSPSHPWPQP